METKYIQNDKQKKSLKNKINRESVICDKILNNLRYMYLQSHIIVKSAGW